MRDERDCEEVPILLREVVLSDVVEPALPIVVHVGDHLMRVSRPEAKFGSGRESGWGIVVRQPDWVMVEVYYGVGQGFWGVGKVICCTTLSGVRVG